MAVDIDDDVAVLSEQIDALKQLGAKVASAGEVYDVSIRWGTALAGRLPRLLHYSSLGLLSSTDEQRFHSVCEALRAVSAAAAHYGLPCPSLPPPRTEP